MGLLESVLNFFKSEEVSDQGKDIGRNDLCWCGSGKKYKRCHLAADDEKRAKKNSAACSTRS